MVQRRVLVVGGGVGGLCLAQGLKKRGIPFTVFERDPSPNHRTQGYRVRINGDGYRALKATLSTESLDLFLRTNAAFEPGFAFIDSVTGKRVTPDITPMTVPSNGEQQQRGHAYATDRSMLRAVLSANLTAEELRYGKVFTSYKLLPNNEGVQVEFANGEVEKGEFLVGADGTNSLLRKQFLPNDCMKLLDTDGRAIYGKTPLTLEFEKTFPKPALKTTALTTHRNPHMSLFTEPMRFSLPESPNVPLPPVKDYLYWVLVANSKVFGTETATINPDQLKAKCMEATKQWHPSLREVFKQQVCSSLVKFSTAFPEYQEWAPSRVTLIGDAIHPMVPAGIGANTALKDVHVLLECFEANGVGVPAIGEYEKQMRSYAVDSIIASLGTGGRMFSQPPLREMKVI